MKHKEMTMKTGYFSEKMAPWKRTVCYSKMLLKDTKTLAQQADPIKLQRSQPGGVAVALWLLQSTCPCILRYIRTSSFTIAIYISRANHNNGKQGN